MDKYIKWLTKNGYSKNTITTYRNILRKCKFLLSDIRILKNYLLSIENANTAWTEYNVIISYMKFLNDKRIKSLKEIKLKPIPTIFKEVFSKNFLYRKTNNLNDYRCIIIRLLFETGIRASELKTIKEINRSTIKVLGKGNKIREIFHNNETTKLFRGFDLTTKTLRLWVKEILGDKYTPHSIRRSHATHMLINGANPKTVMLQLGHKKIETTYRYLHLSRRKNISIYRKYF